MTRPFGIRNSVFACSFRRWRSAVSALPAAVGIVVFRTVIVVSAVPAVECAATMTLPVSKAWAEEVVGTRDPGSGKVGEVAVTDSGSSSAETTTAHAAETAAQKAAAQKAAAQLDLPEEALTLLAQSLRDSCAICAEKNRKKAFAQLDDFYAPGRLLTMAGETRFVSSPDMPNELGLLGYDRPSPVLTFRFHHSGARLVGVEEADETESVWLEEIAAAGPRGRLEGTIEVIPYPYGDGVSYLFSPSEGHLQIQCRILEISAP